MKKNVKKIFIILMFLILIFSFFVTSSYGYNWDFERFDGMDTGEPGQMVESAGATIITIFQVIALGIAIMMLIATGIMYVAASTGDEKAKLKKHLPNYIVGVVFTFAAAAILGIVRDFIDSNFNP